MFTIKKMLAKIKSGLIKKDFIDNIKPVGVFTAEEYIGEDLIDSYTEKNLILNGAFDIVSSLLISGDADKVLEGIAIGDQGIVDSVTLNPYVTDTTLRNEVFRKIFTSTPTVSNITKTISFQMVVDETEANGSGSQIINEAATYSVDGTLFSRKVFREFVKTPENRLVFTWTYTWA